jgi:hypothetical protein
VRLQTIAEPAPRRAAPFLAALAAAAAAAAAGAAVASVQAYFHGTEILLAVLVGLICLAPLGVRVWQGRFDLFEPLTLVAAVFFLYFSFAPLVRLLTYDFSYGGRSFEPMYGRGLLLVTIPILAAWVGYALPLGRSLGERFAAPLRLTEPGLRVMRRWGWVMTAAAFAGTALWLVTFGLSPTRFLLPGVLTSSAGTATGPDVAWFFLAMEWLVPAFLLLVAARGFPGRWALLAYLAVVLLMYVSMAFRYRLVVFLIAAVTLYYLRRERRPSTVLLGAGGGLLFMAAGWLSLARLYINTAGQYGSLEFSLEAVLKAGLADTRIFESFMAVTYLVPDYVDYAYFDPLVYPAVLPVPRALWPGKPLPEWLGSIGKAIGTPEAVYYGAAVPGFGEYYLAFGWVGMAVGMVTFGVLARALWAWFRTDPRDPARQVVFAISNIWLMEVIIRGYLAQIVREWCFFILPALLVMWAARRAQRRALAAGA